MRHRKKECKLSRTKAHRKSLFRNLLTSLIINGSLMTTDAKAKELKSRADHLVNLAKKGTLHARKLAAMQLYGHQALKVLFNEFPARFRERESGYTRIVKIRNRKGDGALISLIEFLPPSAPGNAADEKK